MSRPLVGITTAQEEQEEARHTLRPEYVRSVERAGAVPVALPPLLESGAVQILLSRLDGLVLSGGSDLHPSAYGQPPHPKLGRVVRERDDFELELCRRALEQDLPILAICRGHQVLNVATGGTLLQDIPSEVAGGADHDPAGERWEPAHEVRIEPGTRLRAILGKDLLAVNSIHHQAVDVLGKGLVASARCPIDGIIEAAEAPGRRFVVGVQWHPESFWDRPESHQALFDALAQACSAR